VDRAASTPQGDRAGIRHTPVLAAAPLPPVRADPRQDGRCHRRTRRWPVERGCVRFPCPLSDPV